MITEARYDRNPNIFFVKTDDGENPRVFFLGSELPQDVQEYLSSNQVLEYLPTKEELVESLRDLRWRTETGGIAVSGVSIATDDRSKIMIVGSVMAAQMNPEWTTTWQTSDGQSVPIDASTMIAIGNAVQDHVNRCFTSYNSVESQVSSGSITTLAEVEAAFLAGVFPSP